MKRAPRPAQPDRPRGCWPPRRPSRPPPGPRPGRAARSRPTSCRRSTASSRGRSCRSATASTRTPIVPVRPTGWSASPTVSGPTRTGADVHHPDEPRARQHGGRPRPRRAGVVRLALGCRQAQPAGAQRRGPDQADRHLRQGAGTYNPFAEGVSLRASAPPTSRPRSAYYDVARARLSGPDLRQRRGERATGRAFGHLTSGDSYELPSMGQMAFEKSSRTRRRAKDRHGGDGRLDAGAGVCALR